MDLPALLSLISTVAVVVGLVFASLQVRAAQQQRVRDSGLQLARSFQTFEFMKATRLIMSLPDGMSKQALADRLRDQDDLLWLWTGTMESLGILVFHHELDLELVDEFFSGLIVVGWRKLSRWVADFREETQRPTMGEWFEWLADRMQEREAAVAPVPAQIAHRDWQVPYSNDGHTSTPGKALRGEPPLVN
jgi:hypothetical protein